MQGELHQNSCRYVMGHDFYLYAGDICLHCDMPRTAWAAAGGPPCGSNPRDVWDESEVRYGHTWAWRESAQHYFCNHCKMCWRNYTRGVSCGTEGK